MKEINIPKVVAWDILRCCMLWYEGCEPTSYGFDKEISRIGKQLADALYNRTEKLIKIEKIKELYWRLEK